MPINKSLYRLRQLCDFINSQSDYKKDHYDLMVRKLNLPFYPHEDKNFEEISANLRTSILLMAKNSEEFDISDYCEKLIKNSPDGETIFIENETPFCTELIIKNAPVFIAHFLILFFYRDIVEVGYAIRVCSNEKCDNIFVSTHKRKIYCGHTCRSSNATRKYRDRIKCRLK